MSSKLRCAPENPPRTELTADCFNSVLPSTTNRVISKDPTESPGCTAATLKPATRVRHTKDRRPYTQVRDLRRGWSCVCSSQPRIAWFLIRLLEVNLIRRDAGGEP